MSLPIIPSGGLQNISRFFPNLPGEQSDEQIAVTYLGTPVYSNLIFNGKQNPNSKDNAARNPDLVINDCIIEVNQEKIVQRTSIQGRNGTIKEYISMGDYDIFIQGLIVSPYMNVFPKDDLIALKDLLELPESLEVSSDFLQIFSVHNIVVLGHSFGQMQGYRNQVPFTIRAVSDMPIELKQV